MGLATLVFPGGYDAGSFYLRPWWPGTTAPAWVHLFLSPITGFRWPFPWTILALISVLAVAFAARAWESPRWWVAVFSAPMLINIWLGQIEVFGVLGAALGWLAATRRLHPFWLGVAWVGLATKVQVGAGLIALYAWWTWREQGWKALLWSGLFPACVVSATLLLYGNWLPFWIESLQRLAPQERSFNSALFPYGLAAWPAALIPADVGKRRRVRMFAAATLLGSPYFTTYHCTTLASMAGSPAMLLVSGLVALFVVATGVDRWGWLIPLAVLAWDMIGIYGARHRGPF